VNRKTAKTTLQTCLRGRSSANGSYVKLRLRTGEYPPLRAPGIATGWAWAAAAMLGLGQVS